MLWVNRTRFRLPQMEPPYDPAVPYQAAAGYETAPVAAEAPFTELLLSWNADTPPGTAVRPAVRVQYGAADAEPEAATWSAWHALGQWSTGGAAADRPQSWTPAHPDPAVRVEIDAVRLQAGFAAEAFQVRIELRGGPATPVVRLLAVSTTHRGQPVVPAAQDPPLGQAVELAVPRRSQRVERADLSSEICSPTSVGMVMEFYGHALATQAVADGVFDHGAEIYGNWPFNVAYAASQGFEGMVRHFATLGAVEQELQAGHPVIISVAFDPGELPESPMESTAGHLLVITGVTAAGDFHVNDPAADPGAGEPVARIYSRAHLRQVFLGHGGVGYVITPGRVLPDA